MSFEDMTSILGQSSSDCKIPSPMKKALREKVIVKNKKKMDVIMMKPMLSIGMAQGDFALVDDDVDIEIPCEKMKNDNRAT